MRAATLANRLSLVQIRYGPAIALASRWASIHPMPDASRFFVSIMANTSSSPMTGARGSCESSRRTSSRLAMLPSAISPRTAGWQTTWFAASSDRRDMAEARPAKKSIQTDVSARITTVDPNDVELAPRPRGRSRRAQPVARARLWPAVRVGPSRWRPSSWTRVSHASHWRLDLHQCSASFACIQSYRFRLHMQGTSCRPCRLLSDPLPFRPLRPLWPLCEIASFPSYNPGSSREAPFTVLASVSA